MTELSGRAIQWESNDNANSGVYTIEVIASGIDNVTASVSYTLTVEANCLVQTIQPPDTINDQTYQVGDSQASYEVDEFENDSVNYCDVTYSVEFDQSLTWISALDSGRGV